VEEFTRRISEVWNPDVKIKFQIIRRRKNVDTKINTVYTVDFFYFVLKKPCWWGWVALCARSPGFKTQPRDS